MDTKPSLNTQHPVCKPLWATFMKGAYFILLLYILGSCSIGGNPNEKEIGDGIDLSADGKKILLSYVENEELGVFEYDLSKSSLSRITKSEKAWHLRPKYSPDENYILYINYPNQDFKTSNIVLLDLKNRTTETIVSEVENIVDADFSTDGQSVFFIKATSIGKVPNGNDLYKIDLKSMQKQRVTNFESYSFSGLNPLNDSTILAKIGVMGSLDIQDGKFTTISVENDPRKEVADSHTPIDIKDNILYYYAPYQIYRYNLHSKDNKLELDWRGKGHMSSIKMDKAGTKIAFTQSDNLFIYDLATEEVNKIEIK